MIPMGLYDDADLKALGIASRSMEDYLIKLLIADASLRQDVPQLRQLLDMLLLTVRAEPYNLPFDSSKQVFQLIKSILKRYSDTGIVRWLLERANKNVFKSVTGTLFDRLVSATAT